MKKLLKQMAAVLAVLALLCPSGLAAERVRSIPVSGTVFRAFSDELVGDAVVEIHQGLKHYTAEAWNDSWKSDYLETYQDEAYSDEPLASTVTAADGTFALEIPLKAKPAGINDQYDYTLVIRKAGWLTQYVKIHFTRPEDSTALFTGQTIPLAPEGSSFSMTARSSYGEEQSTGDLCPYTRMSVTSRWRGSSYYITEVELYLNGELFRKWIAPEEQKTAWLVCSLKNGMLFVVDAASDADYFTGDQYSVIVYPSWLRTE